mgnify:CR=1 FL=1
MPGDRAVGWIVSLGITALAGALRFADLARPKAVVFDETYYMKDAFSLLRWGYERSFVDRANDKILAEGIEKRVDLATLCELGVDLGQGYLLGRPAAEPQSPRPMGLGSREPARLPARVPSGA